MTLQSGSQMVCVNMDSMDKHAQMVIGRFEENGGSGYLLKSQYQRPKDEIGLHQGRTGNRGYEAAEGLATPPPPMKLTVNVLSAQQLPPLTIKSTTSDSVYTVSVMNPLVKITLHDEEGESITYATQTVLDNAFNPVWNQVQYIQFYLLA